MRNKPNYIIYAPSYNENSGGSIVLHKLCHVLNEAGENAYIWPRQRKLLDIKWKSKLKSFTTCEGYNTPVANLKHLLNAIVIYPEVTSRNPLKAKNVVRWFLHKPGYHTGKINYGKNELYFFFSEAFNDPSINKDPDNYLRVLAINPAYVNQMLSNRSGSCYMMRKGEGRPLLHDISGSVKLDGMSHKEIAEIFNRTEIFYSYDEFTMYSQYAALCGCVSVVMPATYDSRSEWVASHSIFEYGVAYGINDIAHAKETQYMVRALIDKQEASSLETVNHFLRRTYDFFGFSL